MCPAETFLDITLEKIIPGILTFFVKSVPIPLAFISSSRSVLAEIARQGQQAVTAVYPI